MAGEYGVARRAIEEALEAAARDPGMSPATMADALLGTLLSHMLATRSRADLASLVAFQIEAAGEDEFVITRGS